MRYFSEKILRLRFAPLRMTHYFNWVQTLQIIIYRAVRNRAGMGSGVGSEIAGGLVRAKNSPGQGCPGEFT